KKTLMALAIAAATVSAFAAGYPEKTTTIVVPFPPGGSTDAIARVVAQKLQEKFGQSFIIDNRAGATGTIGAAFVKRAPADGYTLLVTSLGPLVITPHLIKAVQYDALKDFEPITVLVQAAFVNINSIIGQIKAGKVRALAISSGKRSPLLPNVPTLQEQGVKGAEVESWQAMVAPKGIPADVKAKLHDATIAALNDPSVKPKLLEQGFEIVGDKPDHFAKFQATEYARWKAL